MYLKCSVLFKITHRKIKIVTNRKFVLLVWSACDDLDLCSSHANPRAGVFEGVYNKFPQIAYPPLFLREQGTRKTLLFLVNERHVNERHVVPLIF